MTVIEDRSAPGTLQLIDQNGEMHVKHSESGAKDIVLVPMPSGSSSSPHHVHPTDIPKMTQKIP